MESNQYRPHGNPWKAAADDGAERKSRSRWGFAFLELQAFSTLDQIDRGAGNPSDLAIHLSRRARGLPFWFSLATHGTDRYVAALERTLETTRTVAEAIRASDHLALVCEPELSVLLFERPGWDEDAYAVWSNALAKKGVILCVPTKWHGQTVLRLAFVNPDTQPARVIEVLQTLR